MTMFRFNRFRFPDEGPSRKRSSRRHGDRPTYTPVEPPTRARIWKGYGAWLLLAAAAATPAALLVVDALQGNHEWDTAVAGIAMVFGLPTLIALAAAVVPLYRGWQARRLDRISDLEQPIPKRLADEPNPEPSPLPREFCLRGVATGLLFIPLACYVSVRDTVSHSDLSDARGLAIIATPIAILSLIALFKRLYQERRFSTSLEDPARS